MNNERIVALTDEPISDELKEIIEWATRGQVVTVEEIWATPEAQEAERHLSGGVETHKLANREVMQERIKNEILQMGSATVASDGSVSYNGAVEKGKRLDIVMGLPASGKSSAIADTLSAEFQSRVIDNDTAKAKIPQFDDGWGSDMVHKESQIIEANVFAKAIENGDNIVLPKVGSNAYKLLNQHIAQAKEAGYSVNVHYVELDRNKALGRMLNRFVDTGRWLNPGLIDRYAPIGEQNRCEVAYEALKESPEIEGFSRWNNDVGYGEKPLLIETNMQGGFIDDARRIHQMGNDREDSGAGREGRGQILDVSEYPQSGNSGLEPGQREGQRPSNEQAVSGNESRESDADERTGSASSSRGNAGLDFQKIRVSIKEKMAQKRKLVDAYKKDASAKTKSQEHDI